MKYVLDAGVAFKWLVTEPDSAKAISLRNDYAKGVVELLAPDVFPTEVTHALTRAERRGRVTSRQGATLFQSFLIVLPILHNSLGLLPRAYEISSNARIAVYDCLYVALAERENCDLITSDSKLIKNLSSQFAFLKPLSSHA